MASQADALCMGYQVGRRGLEAWTNGIVGSQFAFPETDYWGKPGKPDPAPVDVFLFRGS